MGFFDCMVLVGNLFKYSIHLLLRLLLFRLLSWYEKANESIRIFIWWCTSIVEQLFQCWCNTVKITASIHTDQTHATHIKTLSSNKSSTKNELEYVYIYRYKSIRFVNRNEWTQCNSLIEDKIKHSKVLSNWSKSFVRWWFLWVLEYLNGNNGFLCKNQSTHNPQTMAWELLRCVYTHVKASSKVA